MAWVTDHWMLFFVSGALLLIAGSAITIGALTGLIKNRTNIEGELGYGFSTKTWNPFPPLNLNEGEEATFYIDMRPNTSLTEWGFFLYITNSSGQSVKTISRGSAFGGAVRNIEISFMAPYTDTYQIRVYASSAPPNSLQVHSSVSIMRSGQNAMVLALGVIPLILGVILLSVSLYKNSIQSDAHAVQSSNRHVPQVVSFQTAWNKTL